MSFARRKSDFESFMPFSRRKTDLQENIIFLDPDKSLASRTVDTLRGYGIDVLVLDEAESALQRISSQWNGVLVIPFDMPLMGGLEFLERVKTIDEDLPVLMLMEQGDIPRIVSAMRLGAYDVIEKPFRNEEFQKIIRCALEKRNLVLENRGLRSEIAIREKSGSFIIGKSGAMARLCETIGRVAEVDADVLLEEKPERGRSWWPVVCTSKARDGKIIMSPSIVARSLRKFWKANCLATNPVRSPTPIAAGSVSLNTPRGGRCTWMKLTACRCTFRESSFAFCRKERWKDWAPTITPR